MSDDSRHPARDDGFTLVEVLVASLLLAGVLLVAGTVYVTLTRTEGTVREVDETTSGAQAAAMAIDVGVRNASEVHLTEDDTLLVARTSVASPDEAWRPVEWTCTAWYFEDRAGDATDRIWTLSRPDGTGFDAPGADDLSGWLLLLDDVEPRSGDSVFAREEGDDADPRLVLVAFDGVVPDRRPVAIDLATRPLVALELETTRCS